MTTVQHMSAGQLSIALTRAAEEGDSGPGEVAALRLLISHGKWIERFAFRACCRSAGEIDGHAAADVSWDAVFALLTAEEPERSVIGSPTSWAILRLAHLLATDGLDLSRLDHSNAGVVVEAMATAMGWTFATPLVLVVDGAPR